MKFEFPEPPSDERAAAISRAALRTFPGEPATATAEEIVSAGRKLCEECAEAMAESIRDHPWA